MTLRFIVLFWAFCSTAHGQINFFLGKWKNVDPNATGITFLNISLREGDRISIEAWSKCHPEDCYWGEAQAHAYAPNPSSSSANIAVKLSVVFRTDSVETLIIINRPIGSYLSAEALSRFPERIKARSNFRTNYTFIKASRVDSTRVPLTPETIDEFIAWASRSTVTNDAIVEEEIKKAQNDTTVLRLLFGRLQKTRQNDLGSSLITLSIIGQMRNPAAIEKLYNLVREEMPKGEEIVDEGLTKHDALEMLKVKAVHGLAYIRTPQADSLVLRIIRQDSLRATRVAGIDAFLYNRGDSPEAKKQLEPHLKPEDKILLDRVRYTSTITPEEFNEGLNRFYELHPEQLPPDPGAFLEQPERDDRKYSGKLIYYLPLLVVGLVLLSAMLIFLFVLGKKRKKAKDHLPQKDLEDKKPGEDITPHPPE